MSTPNANARQGDYVDSIEDEHPGYEETIDEAEEGMPIGSEQPGMNVGAPAPPVGAPMHALIPAGAGPAASSEVSNVRHRRFTLPVTASMADFHAENGNRVTISNDAILKELFGVRGFDKMNAKARSAALDTIRFLKITAIHTESDFPVTLAVNINDVTRGNYYSMRTGSRSALHVGRCADNSHRIMLQAIDSTSQAFAKRYKGYSSGNIATQGVQRLDDTDLTLVAADHPVVQMIKSTFSSNPDALNSILHAQPMVGGKHQIPNDFFDKALSTLQTEITDKMPDRNIKNGITFEFSRVDGRDFSDATGVHLDITKMPVDVLADDEAFASMKKAAIQRIMNHRFNIDMTMLISFEPVRPISRK